MGGRTRDALGDPEFKKLSVLITTAFIDMVGFLMVAPLLPFYALNLRASPVMIGAVMAIYPLAQLASAPFWGWVSDRHGRRPALLAGLAASAVAYAVFGLATSVWFLLASRLIQGAGGGTTGVVHAYVSDSIEPARRAAALGWLTAATSLGVAIGPVIGAVALHLGNIVPGLLAALLCLLNVFFTWRWLPESRLVGTTPPDGLKRKPVVWSTLWSVVAKPTQPVSRLIWIYGAGMLGFSAMNSVFALFLGDRFGVTARNIWVPYTYIGILSVVMRGLVLGPVVKRVGEAGAMRLGTVSLVIGLVVYPLVPSVWMLPFIMPLIPIGTALLFPATTALMSRASDPATMGVTMGVAQTFAGTARVLAPLIATSTFQRFGSGMPFVVAAVIVAGVGVLAFRLPVSMTRPAEGAGVL